MKVILVDPSIETANLYPSLGLMYIAAVLEKANIETEIIEMRFLRKPWINLKQTISNKKPQVIGIGCFSYNFHDAIKVARLAKNVDGCITTVIGGSHVSLLPQESIIKPEVDIIVIGEGEYTMLELVKALEQNEDIKAAIILEMIGVYSDKPFSQEYPPIFSLFYPNKANFIAVVGNFKSGWLVKEIKSNFKKYSDFPIESVAPVSPCH